MPVFTALVFFWLVSSHTQFAEVFEFDPDEGYNLAKALLVEQGYTLYAEIWSDQPPLYTYLLRAFFNQFGWTVENARLLTLLFSSLLLLVLYDSVRMAAGHFSAIATVALLVLSSNYVPLSVAAMVGLPSIAFAVGSVWMLARWRASGSPWSLALSGGLLGCALATKLFTAFLLPLVGIMAFASAWRRSGASSAVGSGLIWGLGLFLTLAIIVAPDLSQATAEQLIGTHASGRSGMSSSGIGEFLRDDAFMFGLAAAGMGVAFRSLNIVGLAFSGWLLLAVLGMSSHSPIWYHHILLLSVPASALAGLGLGTALGREHGNRFHIAAGAIALTLLLVAIVYSHPTRLQELIEPRGSMSTSKALAVERSLAPYEERVSTMISSRQIYAFRLGLTMPPNLAVTSLKRFGTGNIDYEDILVELRHFKPDIVLLDKRWPKRLRRRLIRAMGTDYELVYEADQHQDTQVFVTRGLAAQPSL